MQNIVYYETNVESYELFRIDVCHPLPDVITKRENPQALVEGEQSCFFHSSAAAAEAISHIYPTRFEGPVAKELHIPSEPSGERESQSCSRSSSLVPNSIGSESPPATNRVAP